MMQIRFPFLESRPRRLGLCGSVLTLLLASAVVAQPPQPQTPIPPDGAAHTVDPKPAARVETMLLKNALLTTFSQPNVSLLADSSVAFERVPTALLAVLPAPAADTASASETEAATEKRLDALVKTLPAGSLWAKLYLPAPTPGRKWKGDDVAAFAYAQARLFGTIGTPAADGSIEIMGKRIGKDATLPYVAGLALKPVYLLTNPKRQVSAGPWSAANEQQWATMSREERRQYGEQQAAEIMALSPEQRAQVLDQIRQHDKFFDTVKDPLEKLMGHDL